MSNKIAEWRQEFFRMQLYSTTYKFYLRCKEELQALPADMCAEMGIDPDEADFDQDGPMTEWPEFF